MHVFCQPVGIFPDDIVGGFPVFLINTQRKAGRNAVAGQKKHGSPGILLLVKLAADIARHPLADALYL